MMTEHIQSFRTKESFVRSKVKELQLNNVSIEDLEVALSDLYDIAVPPKDQLGFNTKGVIE